ncbi:MAG: PRC-barrel domain-containing protein [Cypionkella sp.]
MLFKATSIKGYAIAATDGTVGKVVDLLFDDLSWQIRWAVVQTGGWFSDRKVLLPFSALGHADPFIQQFMVKLTIQQIKASPDINTDLPVSRQMETDIYGHYGWLPYWGGGSYLGLYGYGAGLGRYSAIDQDVENRLESEVIDARRESYDPHLRSVTEVMGYHIHATDGEIGHVEDLLVEEGDWAVHYLVIETHNLWPGKRVLISPLSGRDIGWSDRLVNIGVDRESVRNSPDYDPEMTIDRDYDDEFNTYYRGLPKPNRPAPDGMYSSGA